MDDRTEIIEELEDIADELEQVISRVQQVERSVPGGAGQRVRQVRAQLEQALSNDNEWMGNSSYNLRDSIDELLGEDDEDEEE